MPYFWHSNWHYLDYISGKVAKRHFPKVAKFTGISQNTPRFISIGPPITKQRPLKIWEICVFLAAPFSQNKLLTFATFGQRFIILKNWGIWVNYCWNYGPSKLLLQFIEYRLDQLNNKHTKIEVNSAIQYFEGCSQNKCLLNVWSFFVSPTIK